MDYSGELVERPLPLDVAWRLPSHLDGSLGANRAASIGCQIDATTDLEAIRCWLSEFDGSPHTQRQYRKEAERLLLWAIRQRNKPLSGLLREDFQAYQLFLGNPQPTHYWCGPRAVRHSVEWRPFKGPLSQDSQRQAMIVVNALLSYLVDARYLSGNPLSLIRRRNKVLKPATSDTSRPERFLDQATWNYLKRYMADLPRKTAREKAIYERTRFLFHFLYLLAPRASEVADHPMNSFREVRGRWWWFVLGKGEKKAKVPVTDEMLEALMRYRQFLDLSPFPKPDDTSPLLRSIKGTRRLTSNMIYRLVKEAVKGAADSIRSESPIAAEKLESATTHWFRHTSITHGDDKGVRLKYLNMSARHDKFETTALYQHAEDDFWHEEWSKLTF